MFIDLDIDIVFCVASVMQHLRMSRFHCPRPSQIYLASAGETAQGALRASRRSGRRTFRRLWGKSTDEKKHILYIYIYLYLIIYIFIFIYYKILSFECLSDWWWWSLFWTNSMLSNFWIMAFPVRRSDNMVLAMISYFLSIGFGIAAGFWRSVRARERAKQITASRVEDRQCDLCSSQSFGETWCQAKGKQHRQKIWKERQRVHAFHVVW